jgi:hypothetical protein
MSEPTLTFSISSELDSLEESISNWQPVWTDLDQIIDSLEAGTGDQSSAKDELPEHVVSISRQQTGVVG